MISDELLNAAYLCRYMAQEPSYVDRGGPQTPPVQCVRRRAPVWRGLALDLTIHMLFHHPRAHMGEVCPPPSHSLLIEIELWDKDQWNPWGVLSPTVP